MGATARPRTFITVVAACAGAVAADWLIGLHGLGLAFAAGGIAAAALVAASGAAASGHQLSAVTAEPAVGWAEFHRELTRARRFDRAFGIVRFADVGAGIVTDVDVRDRVAALARRIDRVWLDGGDLFMLLPESDAAAVELAVARARGVVGEALGVAQTSAFPANGITSGSLVACLYQEAPAPVAIAALTPIPPVLDSASSSDDGGDVAEAT